MRCWEQPTDRSPPSAPCRLLTLLLLFWAGIAFPAQAVDIERDPIRYSTAPVNTAVSRLQQRIEAGEIALPYDDHSATCRRCCAS